MKRYIRPLLVLLIVVILAGGALWLYQSRSGSSAGAAPTS